MNDDKRRELGEWLNAELNGAPFALAMLRMLPDGSAVVETISNATLPQLLLAKALEAFGTVVVAEVDPKAKERAECQH